MNEHGENGKKRKPRNYTKEQKEEAVEDALEIGNSASARMHGVPLTTLSGWVKAAKKAFATNDQEKEKHSVPAFGFEPPKSKERKAARRYTSSQKAQMLEYSSNHGIAATHRKYDVSRSETRNSHAVFQILMAQYLLFRGLNKAPTKNLLRRNSFMQPKSLKFNKIYLRYINEMK